MLGLGGKSDHEAGTLLGQFRDRGEDIRIFNELKRWHAAGGGFLQFLFALVIDPPVRNRGGENRDIGRQGGFDLSQHVAGRQDVLHHDAGRIGKIDRAVSSLARALEVSRPHLASVSVAGRQVEPYVEDLLDMLSGTASLLRDQSSTLDAVVASHENNAAARQNDDVRRISAIAALLSVPALTAGIFGMNFADLPLVKVAYGWTWVLAGAVLVDVVVFLLFRRRGWLCRGLLCGK